MPSLDQPHAAPSPAWTGDKVRARLVEAFEIDRRLPGERRKWQTGSWPAIAHDWRDQVHWTNSGDSARDRNWQKWETARDVAPAEVTRMEEAFAWLRWLPVYERRYLEAWAKAQALGVPVRRMLKYRGWPITTFYRGRDSAVARITARLNGVRTDAVKP